MWNFANSTELSVCVFFFFYSLPNCYSNHVVNYLEKCLLLMIQNVSWYSVEIPYILKSKDFLVKVSTYDISTLCTTFAHNLIQKLTELIY